MDGHMISKLRDNVAIMWSGSWVQHILWW